MKKKLFLFAAVLMINLSFVQAQSSEVLAKSAMLNAEQAFSEGDFEKCIENLDKAIDILGQTNSRIQYLKVKSYIEIGKEWPWEKDKWILAKIALKLFFAVTPENSYVPEKYEEMLLAIGKVDDAITASEGEHKKKATSAYQYNFNDGSFKSAGQWMLQIKDYKKAIEAFDKAIEVGNQVRRAYFGRAEAKSGLNDYYGAVQDYKKAFTYPMDQHKYHEGMCYMAYAECLIHINELDSARKYLKKYVETDNETWSHYNSGKILMLEIKDVAAANKEFGFIEKYIIETKVSNSYKRTLMYQLACIKSMQGKKTEAISALTTYFELNYFGKEWENVKSDPALENIRNMKEFNDLLSKYKDYTYFN